MLNSEVNSILSSFWLKEIGLEEKEMWWDERQSEFVKIFTTKHLKEKKLDRFERSDLMKRLYYEGKKSKKKYDPYANVPSPLIKYSNNFS